MSIPGKMKELGYTTKELLNNAGTLIVTMQLWLVASLLFFTVLPTVMYVLKKLHKQDLSRYEQELKEPDNIENLRR